MTSDHHHSQQVQLFRRVSKDGAHGPYGFQHIHEDTPVFQKPTLLCCGGVETNTQKINTRTKEKEGEKNSNGYAKIGHGLLCYPESFSGHDVAGSGPDIDILSVCYPQHGEALRQDHLAYMQGLKTKTAWASSFARDFAQQHLFPLLEEADGKPKPAETIKRNLRNIQVVAHSYGSTFIQQVGDLVSEKLLQLHFTPEQVRDITSQVLVVSVGPVAPPATGRASFTTVNIINIDDTEIHHSYKMDKSLRELFYHCDLLVDSKNKAVPANIPADIHSVYSKYYPAKPLNIMPVKTHIADDGFHFVRVEKSNQWLACLSPPLIMNGMGDVINVHAIPPLERSNERGIFDGVQTLSRDNTHHQPVTYFSTKRNEGGIVSNAPSEHTEHAATPRILMSSLLINGMNNAVENMRSSTFTPLARADVLMQLPKTIEYITALDVPFRTTARVDNYDKKLAAGLNPNRPPKSLQI